MSDEIFYEPEATGYRIVLKVPKISETTESGIYKPESMRLQDQAKQTTGVIHQIGKYAFAEIEDPEVVVGDRVFIPSYAGTYIKTAEDASHEYRIINDVDVLAKAKEPKGE